MDTGLGLRSSSTVASHQAIEVVAVRSVGAEGLLIKQAFDAAAQANLIGVILETHGPTHLTVPAAAQDHHSSRSQPGGNHPYRPHPARLLFLFTQLPEPVILQKLRICPILGACNGLRNGMNQKGFPGLRKIKAALLTFVRRLYCDYGETAVPYE